MLAVATAEGVAAISVAGALIVAVITAVTTNRRQREALMHDRELADLGDLRSLLDQAVLELEDANRTRDMLEALWHRHGRAVPAEFAEIVANKVGALFAMNARLIVRLGTEDPISIAFEEASDAFYLTQGSILDPPAVDTRTPAEKREIVVDLGLRFTGGLSAFMRAAVKRAGTVHSLGRSSLAPQP